MESQRRKVLRTSGVLKDYKVAGIEEGQIYSKTAAEM